MAVSELDFGVRDGIRYFLTAIDTAKCFEPLASVGEIRHWSSASGAHVYLNTLRSGSRSSVGFHQQLRAKDSGD
jgi:hypothetical protein